MGVDAAFLGNIRKFQCPSSVGMDNGIVSVKTASRWKWPLGWKQCVRQCLARAEHTALNDKNVQITVIVVVEECSTRAHNLGVIMLSRHAVEMNKVDTRLSASFREVFGARSLFP